MAGQFGNVQRSGALRVWQVDYPAFILWRQTTSLQYIHVAFSDTGIRLTPRPIAGKSRKFWCFLPLCLICFRPEKIHLAASGGVTGSHSNVAFELHVPFDPTLAPWDLEELFRLVLRIQD